MPEWLTRLQESINYELFRVGGVTLTPALIAEKLLLLLLILLATRYFARWARHLNDHRVFRRVEPGPRYTMIRLIQYFIYVVGVVFILRALEINLTAVTVVFGALGVGAGLGLQSVVANFVAGLVLLFERPIKVDDYVTTENVEGLVKEIRFRSTLIQTNDNISIIVPNSELTSRGLINWSHGDTNVRLHIPVGVAYGSDIETVRKALMEVASEAEGVLVTPPPEAWFIGFGDSSLNFELLVWTDEPLRHRRLKSRLNYAIDAAFRKYKVQIPFPQRDLHVKTAEGLSGLRGLTQETP